MIRAWRISKERYAQPASAAFDREGARLFGGRWNRSGRPVGYAASSLALASLEYFVSLSPADATHNLVSVWADIPSSAAVERIDLGSLPAGWDSRPGPAELLEIGDRWLASPGT
jgi:RES domain-containing protein